MNQIRPGSSSEDPSSSAAWKASLPPAPSPEQIAAGVKAGKEAAASSAALTKKLADARKEYVKMYEEDPTTWQILDFDERCEEVRRRLANKGITFDTKDEEIALRTSLKTSTIKIWATEEAVDAHDGPDNPANSRK